MTKARMAMLAITRTRRAVKSSPARPKRADGGETGIERTPAPQRLKSSQHKAFRLWAPTFRIRHQELVDHKMVVVAKD
jgi:hypothetical protein